MNKIQDNLIKRRPSVILRWFNGFHRFPRRFQVDDRLEVFLGLLRHLTLMRFMLRFHVNEIPAIKSDVTGPPYTTNYASGNVDIQF